MSQSLKNAIKYWFFLAVGITLITMQVYKYATNTLVFEWHEGVILFLGAAFIIKPTMIPDFILNILNKK